MSHPTDVTVHVSETQVLVSDDGASTVVVDGEPATAVLIEGDSGTEVIATPAVPPTVELEERSTDVVSVGSELIVRPPDTRIGADQQVFVQQEQPDVSYEYLWIETREDGDFSFWFKEAE